MRLGWENAGKQQGSKTKPVLLRTSKQSTWGYLVLTSESLERGRWGEMSCTRLVSLAPHQFVDNETFSPGSRTRDAALGLWRVAKYIACTRLESSTSMRQLPMSLYYMKAVSSICEKQGSYQNPYSVSNIVWCMNSCLIELVATYRF